MKISIVAVFCAAFFSVFCIAAEKPAKEVKKLESGTGKGLNILFFGNSFTMGSGGKESTAINGVPGIVKKIAIAAGKDTPNVQRAASGGKTIEWHLQNMVHNIAAPSQWATIADGFKWNYVVMQEYSTRPTTSKMNHSNPEQFKKDVVTMYQKVAEHSPDVKAVLYETWARYIDFKGAYPENFANPAEFQKQLHDNYYAACEGLNKAIGKDVCMVAPCGDAWEKLEFARSLYTKDLYHGSNEGYLLNGMVIYRTIYGGKIADIKLDELFVKLKVSAENGNKLAGIADSMEIK